MLDGKNENNASLKVDASGAQIVYSELQRCPSWQEIRGDEVEFRQGITRLYLGLGHYNTETIKKGIQDYIASNKPLSPEAFNAEAKIFAFLRVIFDVPAGYIKIKGDEHYGSWGSPVKDGEVNLLWPYSKDNAGNLTLTGIASDYYGPPYDPIAEFEEFRVKYSRRSEEKPTASLLLEGQAEGVNPSNATKP